jgi:hypothetical protein
MTFEAASELIGSGFIVSFPGLAWFSAISNKHGKAVDYNKPEHKKIDVLPSTAFRNFHPHIKSGARPCRSVF